MGEIWNKYKKVIIGFFGFVFFLIILLIIIKACSSSKTAYGKYEDKMISASQKYFEKENKLPITEGGTVEVSLKDLIEKKYIGNYEKELKQKSCDGSVTVRNNGGLYLYIPNLVCDDYKTSHLIDNLLNDVVTEKSGLYQTEDGYVYKGAKVNNFVSFYGKKYLIVSIDSNNILKLVKIEAEKDKVAWDNKFNSEIGRSYGKNDYSDSSIIDYLQGLYTKTDDNKKKHLIGYSVCYGNRNTKDYAITKDYECSLRLDNQFISLLNTYDYSMASYDPECRTIYSGSCSNYNYLFNNILNSTWLMNGVTDNSYDVFYYSSGVRYNKAYVKNQFNMVIYIDGNELFTKGNGSIDNPYVIED